MKGKENKEKGKEEEQWNKCKEADHWNIYLNIMGKNLVKTPKWSYIIQSSLFCWGLLMLL